MLTPEQLQEHTDRYAGSSDGEAQDVRALLQHITEQEAQAAALRIALERLASGEGFYAIGMYDQKNMWSVEVMRRRKYAERALESSTAGQALLDRQRELEEALEPFAQVAALARWEDKPDDLPLFDDTNGNRITLGDLRRAAALKGDKA